jgi:hypothetical protein
MLPSLWHFEMLQTEMMGEDTRRSGKENKKAEWVKVSL